MSIELTNEEKEWLCDCPGKDEACGRLSHLETVEVGINRWHSIHWSIFTAEGVEGLFALSYERGLTESQEGDFPGLYTGNHAEFQPFKVEAKTKTVTEYEGVK